MVGLTIHKSQGMKVDGLCPGFSRDESKPCLCGLTATEKTFRSLAALDFWEKNPQQASNQEKSCCGITSMLSREVGAKKIISPKIFERVSDEPAMGLFQRLSASGGSFLGLQSSPKSGSILIAFPETDPRRSRAELILQNKQLLVSHTPRGKSHVVDLTKSSSQEASSAALAEKKPWKSFLSSLAKPYSSVGQQFPQILQEL